MGKIIDLTGQKFGEWTVLSYAKSGKWSCLCDCGNKKNVTGHSLKRGQSKCCGLHGAINFVDLSGKRFGNWVVLTRAPNDKRKQTVWTCKCDCGKVKEVNAWNLKSAKSTNCGCVLAKNSPKRTHGHSTLRKITTEYNAWRNIKERCYNKKIKAYSDYGGRGVKVCERWLESFQNFIDDMGYKPSPRHSIDRIDVNGDYEPLNCTWATRSQQNFNQRMKKTNTSGYTGVKWNNSGNKWVATISKENRSMYLGSFEYIEDAVSARKEAELKYYGESP